jgi:hypothetical protein
MTTETAEARALRLNAESANAAHADGRHSGTPSAMDRRAWIAMGCTRCALGTYGWGGDALTAERGENYGFQMFTRQGNDALAAAVLTTIQATEVLALSRDNSIAMLREQVEAVSKVHGETYDTEPRDTVLETMDAYFALVGYAPMDTLI